MDNMLKETALAEKHIDLGAKMVEFAGFNMPVQYEGLNAEHLNVREKVGMFDVSHMGEFFVSGETALETLQLVTSNDVSKLTPGKVQYTCMPNRKGGIVDDLLVYCIEKDHYMMVVNASNIYKDYEWVDQNKLEGTVLLDKSDDYALLAVQGPDAEKTLQKLTKVNLSEIPYYSFTIDKIADVDDVIISATGYTGAGGFELYIPNEHAEKAWDKIMSAGEEYGIKPAGLGARDTLRLEMGLALYGNDIDDTTSPLEARLGWITKTETGFINSEAIAKQREEGIQRKLVGFEMKERGIPRQDYIIKNEGGEEIGVVTSGTHSPSLKKSIGMGYVKKPYAKFGTKIFIEIRNRALEAEVVKMPFYKG